MGKLIHATRLYLFLAVALALSTVSGQSWAAETKADFFVSTQGNDAWSGRLAEPNAAKTDGPLATFDGAQKAVRQLKQKEPGRQQPVVVALRGGTYFLAKPICFGPDDSGTAKSPILYQAYGEEQPVLSGGVKLDGWQIGSDGRWRKTLDDVKNGKWAFLQLFVNDQRRMRPRLPKQGYYTIAQTLKPSPKAEKKGHDRFGYSADDIRTDWSNPTDVEVVAFHQWTASRMRIASVDSANHVVTFTGSTLSPSAWSSFPKGNRYLVENVREALCEPGQWYLDRPTGVLTYIPMPGERPESAVVIAPRIERLLTLEGDAKSGRWVQYVEFRGLTFAHGNWTLPPEGQSSPQAEVNLDSTIAAFGARNVTLRGCAVRHVGSYAIAFGLACRDNLVEACELVDLGAGGIKIGHAGGGTWGQMGHPSGGPEDLVSHNTVRQCLIAHGGRLHSAAVGVWIGHSPYNVVEHNDIYDFYYSGISVGWIWGYAKSEAHHNDIGFNHVHTIGQHVLSDMGGIYTLGISPGTRVHDNCFHDVQSFSYGGWGLYTDEGSSDIVMENNLVYRTKTGGFHQHYGKENHIQNNIFAYGTEFQIQRSRTEPHTSFFFERNIVLWNNATPALGSNWKDDHFKNDWNVYWNSAGQPVKFPGGLTFDQWQQKRGQDQHSIVADPKFVAPEKDDFRLQPDSPVSKVGFKPFDASKAGRKLPVVLTRQLPPVPKTFE